MITFCSCMAHRQPLPMTNTLHIGGRRPAAAAAPPRDLSHVPLAFITMVLQRLSLKDRFTCGLVCKAWAEAATVATCSIILERQVEDDSNLLLWLRKYGNRLEVLQLQLWDGAVLTALPCAQLQDLLLEGTCTHARLINIASKVWDDIAAAAQLTSLSLRGLITLSQPADVVSAMAGLPALKQLTWYNNSCSGEQQQPHSLLLQHLTQLTALGLVFVSAQALQHLGTLTKLQHLSIANAHDWAAAGFQGLQELTVLTRLRLVSWEEPPPSILQLTALQQLELAAATPTALNWLQALTGLTLLCVGQVEDLSLESAPLQLPDLRHLELTGEVTDSCMPMSFLAQCTQLRVLSLCQLDLIGTGHLLASTRLQCLELSGCCINSGDAGPNHWQHILPAPGQFPHLEVLQLSLAPVGLLPQCPPLQQSDIEHVVACCRSLKMLSLDTWQDSFVPALASLSALTYLFLYAVDKLDEQQCGSLAALAQLTGLRELRWEALPSVDDQVPTNVMQQLTTLEQLTFLSVGRLCPNAITPELEGRLVNKVPAGCSKRHVIYMASSTRWQSSTRCVFERGGGVHVCRRGWGVVVVVEWVGGNCNCSRR